MNKVAVILSTYNGEKYLAEQIESILKQEQVEVDVHAFDDCSTDDTLEILKEFEKKYPNIYVHVNEHNKGFTYNFLDGLFYFKNSSKYDFYALSDQDDVWMPKKLITAINKIKEKNSCTLYCSNLSLVDENLNSLNTTRWDINYQPQHYDDLCFNIATGCTIVFDKKFKDLATKVYPENLHLHDHYLALLANYCKNANFIYDSNPNNILYRQHNNNQIGYDSSKTKKIWNILFKRIPSPQKTSTLVSLVYDYFAEDLNENDRIFFEKIKSKKRFYLFKHLKSSFTTRFKIFLLLNKF